ncbi:hypothetical protein [Nonomuraea insulae]|uniref:Uncharacterized protein n=1 Tax=Nonomuraea insulae TaxID=1616787 RepID=A0ABW1CIY0_9ACTN
MSCDFKPEQTATNIPPYAADVTAQAKAAAALAKQCGSSSTAWALPHIATGPGGWNSAFSRMLSRRPDERVHQTRRCAG